LPAVAPRHSRGGGGGAAVVAVALAHNSEVAPGLLRRSARIFRKQNRNIFKTIHQIKAKRNLYKMKKVNLK
jgi:hypothetical protein